MGIQKLFEWVVSVAVGTLIAITVLAFLSLFLGLPAWLVVGGGWAIGITGPWLKNQYWP